MFYQMHKAWMDSLRMQFNRAAQAMNGSAAILQAAQPFALFPVFNNAMADNLAAASTMIEHFFMDHPPPAFGLPSTLIDGEKVAVLTETFMDKPFSSLLHFKRDTDRNDPKILLVAPMSGHYATLLRPTVEALLPSHDVYVAEWKNARDVPLSEGDFGLDDYIGYVQDYMRALGPDLHVMALSQSTVPVLAAAALLAAKKDPCQPLSMTLMGGPIDASTAKTNVTRYALQRSIGWFRDNVIAVVPEGFPGRGRKVYPGALQLSAFMGADPEGHMRNNADLYDSLRRHEGDKSKALQDHYDEFLSVADLPARFYLDTVKAVFHDFNLARGRMVWNGEKIDPSLIHRTALFTVEGGKDDICAPGQTAAAHSLCSGLASVDKFHYLHPRIGHFGLFEGLAWKNQIMPRFSSFIRNIGEKSGMKYAPVSSNDPASVAPQQWNSTETAPKAQSGPKGDNDNRQLNQKGAATLLIA